MVTYDRPQEAKLHVHLENGETFEASKEDLQKFGYVDRYVAYRSFANRLDTILREAGLLDSYDALTSAKLNPLRYLAELAIIMPDLLEHPETAENDEAIVELEKTLRKETPKDED